MNVVNQSLVKAKVYSTSSSDELSSDEDEDVDMGDPHAEIPPRPKSSRATYKIMQSFLIKDVWIDVKVGAIAGHLLYGLVGDRLDEVYKRKYDIWESKTQHFS